MIEGGLVGVGGWGGGGKEPQRGKGKETAKSWRKLQPMSDMSLSCLGDRLWKHQPANLDAESDSELFRFKYFSKGR